MEASFKDKDDETRAFSFSTLPFANELNLRLYWYPISLSRDLRVGDAPVGIHILGDPIVIYRDPKTNNAVCLSDKCAHRSAPLSIGEVRDGFLECKYHGWKYDAEGKVVEIPALCPEKSIPSNAKTRAYPCKERDGVVWIWPADPALAEKHDIPNVLQGSFIANFPYPFFDLATDLDIDHTLMLENLLDPAHLPFTHDGTLSKRSKARPLKFEISIHKDDKSLSGIVETETNRFTRFIFTPPCHIRLETSYSNKRNFCLTMHCIPLRPGHMRLIFRMSRDFMLFLNKIPFSFYYFRYFNSKVVFQDYELLHGQQLRLNQEARAWNSPIEVDIFPKLYRQWYQKATRTHPPWFQNFQVDIEDLVSGNKKGDQICLLEQCDGTTTDSYYEFQFPRQHGVVSVCYFNKYPSTLQAGIWGSLLGKPEWVVAVIVALVFIYLNHFLL